MVKLATATVKGSTLLEVIVAMVIVLIIFSLAIGIYNNVLNSSSSAQSKKSQSSTETILLQSIIDKNYADETTTVDSIVYEKKVLPYKTYQDLIMITVTALVHDKQISKSRRIINKKSNDR